MVLVGGEQIALIFIYTCAVVVELSACTIVSLILTTSSTVIVNRF
jgi:hypothetical protein